MPVQNLREISAKFIRIGKLLGLTVVRTCRRVAIDRILGMTEPGKEVKPEINFGENPASMRADGKSAGALGNTSATVSLPRLRPKWTSRTALCPNTWVSCTLA